MIFFPFIGKILALFVAVIIGLAQGALFFGDGAPNDIFAARFLMSVPLAVVGGVIFGYNFRRVWPLAVLNAWTPIVYLTLVVIEFKAFVMPRGDLVSLLVPVAVSIAAGWLGAKLKALKNLVMLAVTITAAAAIFAATYGYLEFPGL